MPREIVHNLNYEDDEFEDDNSDLGQIKKKNCSHYREVHRVRVYILFPCCCVAVLILPDLQLPKQNRTDNRAT